MTEILIQRVFTVMLTGLLMFPAAGFSQEAGRDGCADESTPGAELGITGMVCRCSYETIAGSESWGFRTEPEILGVRDGGPSEGRLQPGDRITSIDGHLITTPAGGRAWSDVSPGDTVRLGVRRGSGTSGVTIVAAARCPESTGAPAISQTRSPRLPRLHPEGWLGLGLSCDCSVDTADGTPRWTFEANPTVVAVAPESPAAAAGVRPGDVLARIDEQRLDSAEGGMAFSALRPGQEVRLTIERDGELVTVDITAGNRRRSAKSGQEVAP